MGFELRLIKNNINNELSGINLIELDHYGCAQMSDEEQIAIKNKINYLMSNCYLKINDNKQDITYKDFIIVSPYNAQVNFLKASLDTKLNIGTVDKFQGQEAAVVIYSMTSSSPEDAPRGMEFLYNPNRFNVATSRAKALCVLVGSPELLEPACKTPKQMQMANGFCRFSEMARNA